ncbi:MAG: M23 family metallopeptidase [Candidatus Altimarinota bacterium]
MNKKYFTLGLMGVLLAGACNMNFFGQSGNLTWPLEKSWEREQLLTFGLYVTPDAENNPINPPERFSGFHTALDLEVLPGEEDSDVSVKAICTGKVTFAGSAEGYGGVFVHTCVLNEEVVSVLYGHMDADSFQLEVGDEIQKATEIGKLAQAKTAANGYTRKHLHLGIHKGEMGIFKGYVQSETELGEFIDPSSLLPK